MTTRPFDHLARAALLSEASRDLRAYGQWTKSVWAPAAKSHPPRPANDSLLVMGFGLAGETGEVLEFFELDDLAGAQNKDLAKEMGDVFYYWSCLCWQMGVDPRVCWQSAMPIDTHLPISIDRAAAAMAVGLPISSLDRLGVMLASRNGVIFEQLKKKVRDGTFDAARFARSMGQQAQVWCALLTAMDLKASHVLEITIAKVEDRIARGVLLGSGNHR